MQKEGYLSLRLFYSRHAFSFSYEYLRQIVAGGRIPSAKKVGEIARALGLPTEPLQRLASEARLTQKVHRHYRLPMETRAERLAEKVQRYREGAKEEEKIIRMIKKLGEKEKEEFFQYLKFLKHQSRRRDKRK